MVLVFDIITVNICTDTLKVCVCIFSVTFRDMREGKKSNKKVKKKAEEYYIVQLAPKRDKVVTHSYVLYFCFY